MIVISITTFSFNIHNRKAQPYAFEPHWLISNNICMAHFHSYRFQAIASQISQLHRLFNHFNNTVSQYLRSRMYNLILWRDYIVGRQSKQSTRHHLAKFVYPTKHYVNTTTYYHLIMKIIA